MAKTRISLEEYKKAFREVYVEKQKEGFKFHLMAYLFVNVALIIYNLYFYSSYIWFQYPLIFWGIGLMFHYLGVSRSLNSVLELEKRAEEKLKKK
ncbi:MAG: 2TM domain-containing protein [Candidatus Aenigmatarchaeota archaeon]